MYIGMQVYIVYHFNFAFCLSVLEKMMAYKYAYMICTYFHPNYTKENLILFFLLQTNADIHQKVEEKNTR